MLLVTGQCLLPTQAPGQEAPPQPAAAAGATEPAPVERAGIETFNPLWTRSLFTSGKAPPPPPPLIENTDWAKPLSFLGWTEIDGAVTVYLYRADTEETFVVTQDRIPEEGVIQIVEIENPESMLEAKVRVRLNGQETVIAQFDAPILTETRKDGKSAPKASGPVQPPTTADSRAQQITGPILFTEDSTFENSLQRQAKGAAVAPTESTPASEVILELRQRNEAAYDQYPRPDQP